MSTRIIIGDAREKLRELPDNSVHCVVTSPPYFGLRDYGVAGQIGLEPTPDAFVAEMVAVFREVRRVLRADGTCPCCQRTFSNMSVHMRKQHPQFVAQHVAPPLKLVKA